MYLGQEMFQAVTDREHSKQVFKASVRRVEVETHSYCNRRCSYCPNVVGDRLTPNIRMDQDLFSLIVDNLAEIDYQFNFVLNSYNEPLYDRIILERIAEVKAKVPKATTMIYTNGDYLSPGYVDELAEAGLDYLHISIHLKIGDSFTDLYVLNRISEVSHRIGIPAKFTAIRGNEYIIAQFPHNGIKIETRAINFAKHGTDRGGLLKDLSKPEVRTSPCSFPFGHFHIGFSGNVVPCCHIRSDSPEHNDYLVGNLRRFDSIYQAFTSDVAAAWRRELVHDGPKAKPCDTCTAPLLPNTKEAHAAFQRAYQRHVVAPVAATS